MLWATLLPRLRVKQEPPGNPTWQLLHRLASAATPALLRAVDEVLTAVGVSLPTDQLEALAAAGDQHGAEQLLRQAWRAVGERGLEDTVGPQLRALALSAAEATTLVGVDVVFNVQDPEALAAIDAYTGSQIVAISETTLEAVQGIIRRAFESGTPLTQQISEIAEVVGLTPQQAESLATYRQGLVEAGETPGQIETLVARRAAAVRRQRAEVIARTEGLNAVHTGAHERLIQSLRDGLLDPTRVKRFWILGSRPCPVICIPIPGLNPQGVGPLDPFQTPVGPLMYPTAHPACMCVVNMVVSP